MPEAEATIPQMRLKGHLPFKPVQVYVLLDPRDGAVRYVGVTTRGLALRLAGHISAARRREKSPVRSWIKGLLACGLRPVISMIESVPAGDGWRAAERAWIAHYRTVGAHLTNLTDGGDGASGWVPTSEYREARRISSTGRKHTQETIARMSLLAKARGILPETRAKAYVASRRETRTPEMAAKIKATRVNGMQGRHHSEETKVRMSAVQKGRPKEVRGADHKQARAVVIDGQRFGSVTGAGRALGVTQSAISARLRFATAQFATDTEDAEANRLAARQNAAALAKKAARQNKCKRPVIVDGIQFPSLKAAAQHCGIHSSSMIERIQRGRAHYATD